MLAVLMVPISYAQEMNGTWKGILNAGNQELEIVFHFNYQENGNSTAKMDIIKRTETVRLKWMFRHKEPWEYR